jgi:3-oxoacyl-[acyl-carrier-protein] synthase III
MRINWRRKKTQTYRGRVTRCQANKRMSDRVGDELKFPPDRVAMTIDALGNAGCASVATTLHRFEDQVLSGDTMFL